jgi:predicted alpha/beta-fold hydrolase
MVQTLLASLKLRAWYKKAMLGHEKKVILNIDDDIKLLGFHSLQQNENSKGLVILLHGWEGSSHSTYILSCGDFLYKNGYDIFRLNLRDHGNSHHLNTGLFYATLLEEVCIAVQRVASLRRGNPIILVGFSLGGNFAIRVAAQFALQGSDLLNRVVSISPVLNPDKATDKIDTNPIILGYFKKKWRRSLLLKQRLYPEYYDFSSLLKMHSLREMTAYLLKKYTHYTSTQEYFKAYSIPPELTQTIKLPMSIVTAADDPIIPPDDFRSLIPGEQTEILMHQHGGHNGFIDGLFKPAWYDRFILNCCGRFL